VLSFPPEKAASLEAFEYRLREFPQCFFKAESDGRAVWLINGSCSHKPYITDDLYGPAVHPEYRHTSVAHRLMEAYISHLQGSAYRLL